MSVKGSMAGTLDLIHYVYKVIGRKAVHLVEDLIKGGSLVWLFVPALFHQLDAL